jgi:gamma-glutamyl hercynylcysteine S-oxide hydrolase
VCRWIAYVGPPVTLEALLVTPPHSLARQAQAPKHQTYGVDNPDGFGVGWYEPARRPEPARHRTAKPMWEDASFASFAGVVSSTAVVAAVRSATPGFPIEETSSQPFTWGPWLFVHNGSIDDFAGPSGAALRRRVSERRRSVIEGNADSIVLFALALDRLDAGDNLTGALHAVVSTVNDICGGRMNLALTDGRTIAATAWGNSLFTLERGDAVVVASEPYDDEPDWERLPDRSLVDATPGRLEVKPL